MEKNISAELPGQFPFDILIRSKEGKFARTKALNDRNLKLGICIQNRAWLLVRLPTDQSAPEKFLQTLKDITGLPKQRRMLDSAALLNVFAQNER